MIYFTSDFHFGHRGTIEMQNRPFSDVVEMKQQLIRNYNEVVHENDTVYILGDVCHHMRVEEAENVISRLKGGKCLFVAIMTRNTEKIYLQKSVILQQHL